jgi:hypothetical protein
MLALAKLFYWEYELSIIITNSPLRTFTAFQNFGLATKPELIYARRLDSPRYNFPEKV